MNSVFPFFKWVGSTWISKVINDSNWLFPAIEAIHIVALALLFGAALVLNLRLLGVMLRNVPVSRLARELAPWTLCSLIVILISGALLFASEAVKSFYSVPFRVKIVLLIVAILFHYTVGRKVSLTEEVQFSSLFSKATGIVGIILWLSVGFAGRAIAFF
jgi:hypothetical protein